MALFVAALLAGLVFLVHPWYDATNDGSVYIACARSILAGEGYAYLGEPFRVRPPGLAYLIAPLIALRGTDFHALNLLIAAFGALAAFLVYVFQRARLGWSLALLAALTLWLNQGYQRACTQVMTETPGVVLLFVSLLIERRGGGNARTRWFREVLLGLSIAAGAYVRTVNVLLVPSIAAARVLERVLAARGNDRSRAAGPGEAGDAGGDARVLAWPRFALERLAVFSSVAVLALLPWSLRNAAAAPKPPADQTFLYSYGTGMFHEDFGDPRSRRLGASEVLGRIPAQVGRIVEVLGSRMEVVLPLHTRMLARGDEWKRPRNRGPTVTATAALILCGALYGLVVRRRASDFVTWAMLAVISVYFGFDDRLLVPVWVLAFPATLEALRDVGAKLAGARAGSALAHAVCLGFLVVDCAPRADWERIERQHRAFEAIAADVEAELPRAARLAAPIGWHYAVYLDRPVWSLQMASSRALDTGRPMEKDIERVIDRYGLNTVVLSPLVPYDRAYLAYFAARSLRMAESPSAVVARVRR